MRQPQIMRCVIHAANRKSRTLHLICYIHATRNTFCQGGLARANIADQLNRLAATQRSPEPHAKIRQIIRSPQNHLVYHIWYYTTETIDRSNSRKR